jgi:cellulose synthase/poly-beta-1,6-N-acetylglucosamine synthase-like glycosyltransferase
MPVHDAALFIFWISGALLFHTFLGYGLLISACARWRPRAPFPPVQDAPPPAVDIVLVACNEEKVIEGRLRNLLAAQYPPEKLRIFLISDGSTDATVDRARELGDARIEIVERAQRAGKAAGLNLALAQCTAGIVVFADSRQSFAPDALARLTAHFADPAIGAVGGALEIAPAASTTGAGVDAYWRYEKSLRAAESRFDSCIGCTGAIYALRRTLFSPIAEDTLLDDVVIPMQAALRGARVIHDSEVHAFDPQSLEPEVELRRKRRTLAGGFQMFFRHPAWLLPWRNRLWWQLLSHKYLRLLAPGLLVVALAANVALITQPFYAGCLAVQVGFYLIAALSQLPTLRRWKIGKLAAGFVFLNFQVVRGFRYYLAGAGRQGWS